MKKESAKIQIKSEFENGLRNVKSVLDPSNPDQYMSHYFESYYSLLKSSQFLCEQAKDDPNFRNHAIVAIAHMAYGWMPTTLKKCDINGDIERNGKTQFWMHLMLNRGEMQETS